jgi:SAM-dependent methyltransferase
LTPARPLPSAAAVGARHAAFHAELSAHPDPGRRAGWRDERSQRLRFGVCVAALGGESPQAILDVGCGLGDLLPFCRARGFVGDYVGLDLLPEMVDAARARHVQDPRARFAVADVRCPPDWLGARFDLVVACGTLSLRVPQYDAYLDAALDALWALTGGALALVLPSARALRRVAGLAEDFVCHDPSRLRARLLRLTPYLTLREDFLPTDLAAYLYRDRSPAHDALRPSLTSSGLAPRDLAALYLERDLPAAALALIEPIAPTDRDAYDWLYAGQALAALGARDAAAAAFGCALRLDPSLYAAQRALSSLR